MTKRLKTFEINEYLLPKSHALASLAEIYHKFDILFKLLPTLYNHRLLIFLSKKRTENSVTKENHRIGNWKKLEYIRAIKSKNLL